MTTTQDEKPSEKTQSWTVTVERNGEDVVSLGHNFLGGRPISQEDARIIRLCAQCLVSFAGFDGTMGTVYDKGMMNEIGRLRQRLFDTEAQLAAVRGEAYRRAEALDRALEREREDTPR